MKRLSLAGVLWTLLVSAVSAAGSDNQAANEFDQRIAPLLARHCLSCHGPTTKEGGLDLSTAAGARTGGEGGLVIAVGQPDDSRLWQRVAADEMPPDNPLSAADKQLIRDWIADGANWGSDPIDAFRYTTEARAGYDWWSLQPVVRPAVPEIQQSDWPQNSVDQFVLARLQANGLTPARPADSRTLLRRLYFDLIGLPPILQETDGQLREELLEIELDLNGFAEDPAAVAAVVDRLLESPHYGERWARHWLDVIRFGESQGFERNRIRENAWRYRDWVIQSLNKDLPYDEFIRQQIAGDVLYPDDLDALLATGFLVCGTWDQVGHKEGSAEMQRAVRQDHLEDLVGTVGQSLLGLTAHCARCHDHKYDPILQREYYQLTALLSGVTQEEKERSGITARPSSPAYQQWSDQRDEKLAQLTALEQTLRQQSGQASGGSPLPGLQALYLPESPGGDTIKDQSGVQTPLNLVRRSASLFVSTDPATKLTTAARTSGEFTLEVWLTPSQDRQSGPARIVTLSQDSGQRNFTLGQDGSRFDLRFRTTSTDQNGLPSLAGPESIAANRRMHVVCSFERDGLLRMFVDGAQVASRRVGGDLSGWNDGFHLAFGDELSGQRSWNGQLHLVAIYDRKLTAEQISRNYANESADVRTGQTLDALLSAASQPDRSRYQQLQQELKQLLQSEPAAPFDGVAHVIISRQPPKSYVLARGDIRNPGDVVAPRGLAALSRGGLADDFGLPPDAPEGQRRVALANWITDPRNPLTARVMVNRLWHHHFGQGIVDTPSDFGYAGGRPSHPELLDWLAAEFVESGWQIKNLHRLIVLSATYRQASNVDNPAAVTDADNRLLWRANFRRLDAESIRDTLLAVSAELNLRAGGPSYRDVAVKLGTNHEFTDPTGEFHPDVNRRTIYRLWARSGNHPLLETLDCPDPSVSVPRRSQTITPVQSLSLLNNSFVEECASQLAEQVPQAAGDNVPGQVAWLYQRLLLRKPQPQEADLAADFVRARGLSQLCVVLLNTNEFLFVE